MRWYKTHPLFSTLVTVLMLIAVGCAVFVFATRSAIRDAEARYAERQNTLAAFARQQPFPVAENARAVEADLEAKTETLAAIRKELQGRGEAGARILSAEPPATSTEAYFDLANFVESMRAKAEASEIGLPQGTRFGFSAYASSGPPPDRIGLVFRQRLMAEYLLSTLIDSRPRSIDSIQRERPLSASEQQTAAAGSGSAQSADGGDIFQIDRRISARAPGFVDTTAFRVSFVGYTSSLRHFLNQLATFEAPIVVRSVEVAPASGQNATQAIKPAQASSGFFAFDSSAAQRTSADDRVPIVSLVESRFTVTVEFVTLVEPQSAEAQPTP